MRAWILRGRNKCFYIFNDNYLFPCSKHLIINISQFVLMSISTFIVPNISNLFLRVFDKLVTVIQH